MNLVEIAGHLGADPETRVTPNGVKITTLRIATNSRRGGSDVTIWWRVTIFGERFDKMLVHLKKGSALIVVGELNKPEIWMDKEGRPQVTLEVVAEMIKFNPFGRSEKPQEGAAGAGYSGASQQYQSYSPSSTPAQGYSREQQNDPFHSSGNLQQHGGEGSSYQDEGIPF